MFEKAIEVASNHYRFLQEGKYEEWLSTLTKDLRETASVRGSSPDFWWRTGRRYVTAYGVRYEYYKVDERLSRATKVKIFFKRLNPDGTLRGSPVPIWLIKENEEWKVFQASY
ncbi:MAG TPA: hypothetical protein ENF80_03790 [Thermofilum sp.]|nr:hypothetical protein [Thermofilum sp.]